MASVSCLLLVVLSVRYAQSCLCVFCLKSKGQLTMLADLLWFVAILAAPSFAIKLAFEPIDYGHYRSFYRYPWMDAAIAIVELDMLEDQPDVGVPTVRAIGIAFDYNRIITSYNAIRPFVFTEGSFKKAYAVVLKSRKLEIKKDKQREYTHVVDVYKIVCGRQVVDVGDLPDYLWFNKVDQISPLHDLFVMRIDGNLSRTINSASSNVRLVKQGLTDSDFFEDLDGLFLDLADPDEPLEVILNYGHYVYKRYNPTVHMVAQYNVDIRTALTDCNTVLPRNWGRFICIGIGVHTELLAGSILISRGKVVGIGAFLFGAEVHNGMYVFTDIRPYRYNLFYACTHLETSGNQENPLGKLGIID